MAVLLIAEPTRARLERQLRAMDYDFLVGGEARVRRGQKAYDELCASILAFAQTNAIEAEILCRTLIPAPHLDNFERFYAVAPQDIAPPITKVPRLATTPVRVRSSAHRLIFGETQQHGSVAVTIYERSKHDMGETVSWTSEERSVKNVAEFDELVRRVEDAVVMVVYLNGETYTAWDRRTHFRPSALSQGATGPRSLPTHASSVVDARHRFDRSVQTSYGS
jgi:hypothetical protein